MPTAAIAPTVPRKTSPAKVVFALVALVLAAVLLYVSLRGIHWGEVWALLSGAKPSYVALFFAFSSSALFLRALRWRILLSSAGKVSMSTAFWATSIGYLGNNFLPARAGELARTVIISSRAGLANAYVLTTALLERMVDALALVIISALVLLTLPSQPDWLAKASKPFAIVGGLGVLLIAVLPRLDRFGVAILRRLPIPHGICERLLGLFEHVIEGFRTFHDARRAFGFLGLTIVIWCMDAVGAVICARALGLSLPLPVAFLLIAGLGLGSALPSTPGYVGIYQFVAVSILTPFGFRRADAIAYILMVQAISYIMVGLWGSIGFWQCRRTRVGSPGRASEPTEAHARNVISPAATSL
jgi:uncharacterized protein (TIRG00374 family)